VLARLKQAVAYFGGLHGAVNCAGIVLIQPVLGKQGVHDLASFTKVVQVNLIGT
jgi:NAD(P)-dependent dehydrogenase (short-subunit alcohol dehydrogenase family)